MATVKISARLRLATRDDIFQLELPLTNKILFTRDSISKDFKGVYIVEKLLNTRNCESIEELKNRQYYNGLLYAKLLEGIYRNQFYVLEALITVNCFHFKLQLQTADRLDFFDSADSLKQNVIYYKKINDAEIRGPYSLQITSQSDHIKKAIDDGILFVPSVNQCFEPIITAKAS